MSARFVIAREYETETRRGRKGLQSPLPLSQWLQRPPLVPDRDRQSGSALISLHKTLASVPSYKTQQRLREFMRLSYWSEAERTWLLFTGPHTSQGHINHSFPLLEKTKHTYIYTFCPLCIQCYCLWHGGLFMIAAAVPACTSPQSVTAWGVLLRVKEER